MVDEKDIDKANLTTSTTDAETGLEGLSDEKDREQSRRALEEMYKRGLIPDEIYRKKLTALNKE